MITKSILVMLIFSDILLIVMRYEILQIWQFIDIKKLKFLENVISKYCLSFLGLIAQSCTIFPQKRYDSQVFTLFEIFAT